MVLMTGSGILVKNPKIQVIPRRGKLKIFMNQLSAVIYQRLLLHSSTKQQKNLTQKREEYERYFNSSLKFVFCHSSLRDRSMNSLDDEGKYDAVDKDDHQ